MQPGPQQKKLASNQIASSVRRARIVYKDMKPTEPSQYTKPIEATGHAGHADRAGDADLAGYADPAGHTDLAGYADLAALAEADEPTGPRVAPPPYRRRRSRPLLIGLAAIVVVALLAAGGIALARQNSGAPAPAGVRAPASSATPYAQAQAFCGVWKKSERTLALASTLLNGGPSITADAPAAVAVPVLLAVDGVLTSASKVAPPQVSPDLAILTSYYRAVTTDYKQGTTVGEVRQHIKAHPPADAAKVGGAMQHLSGYLRDSCHINLGS